MTKNDGGPAFPVDADLNIRADDHMTGMSLRDWFAGMALQSIVMHPSEVPFGMDFDEAVEKGIHDHAECAYRYADAMLKARQDD